MRYSAFFVLASCLSGAGDIHIRLEGGDVIVKDATFMRVNKYGNAVPILTYKVENRTPFAWPKFILEFQLRAQCGGDADTSSQTVAGTLGVSADASEPFVQNYEQYVIPLAGKSDGCSGEVLDAKLVLAENDKYSIDGRTGERRDFTKEAAAEAAAERKRASAAKARAAQDAQKAAAERTKLRARCDTIYKATIQKRVVDLTVQESKQIEACERLRMYPPR